MAGHSFQGLRFGDTVTAIGRVDAFQRIEWDVNSIRMVRPSIQQGDQVRWRVAADPEAGCRYGHVLAVNKDGESLWCWVQERGKWPRVTLEAAELERIGDGTPSPATTIEALAERDQ